MRNSVWVFGYHTEIQLGFVHVRSKARVTSDMCGLKKNHTQNPKSDTTVGIKSKIDTAEVVDRTIFHVPFGVATIRIDVEIRHVSHSALCLRAARRTAGGVFVINSGTRATPRAVTHWHVKNFFL